jgi:hypothetical protein
LICSKWSACSSIFFLAPIPSLTPRCRGGFNCVMEPPPAPRMAQAWWRGGLWIGFGNLPPFLGRSYGFTLDDFGR